MGVLIITALLCGFDISLLFGNSGGTMQNLICVLLSSLSNLPTLPVPPPGFEDTAQVFVQVDFQKESSKFSTYRTVKFKSDSQLHSLKHWMETVLAA